MTERAEITTIEPDEPGLAVKLQALTPPSGKKGYNDQIYRRPWTLDFLERTLLEFRAAGAWDGSELNFKGNGMYEGTSIDCEVLARRGDDAMPWGWRPSQGPPPPPPRHEPLPNPVVPDAEPLDLTRVGRMLGNRVLHGVLLLVLVVLAVVFR